MAKPDASHSAKILLLDTTDRDQTRLALLDTKEVITLERPARAQELQLMISQIIKEAQIAPADLRAIAVLTGPGSFTGTRIGITAANTLGWLYKLPLIPLAEIDFEQALERLQHSPLPETVKVITPLT